MNRRIIPFGCWPGSWGLRGTTREIAEAEYYLEGEALKRRLIDITESDPVERAYRNLDVDLEFEKISLYEYDVAHAKIAYLDEKKLARALLDIELKHHRLAPYDYDKKVVDLDHPKDDAARRLALLDVEYKHNKISARQYKRDKATLKEEPYIGIVHSDYDPREGINGLLFEFEWNHLWIDYLRLNGYVGFTEEQIVEQWFNELCRAVADENPDDKGDFPFNSGRIINRIRRDGTSTEYS